MWINLGPEYLRGTQLLQITPCYSAMDCSLFCARRISRMHASESFTAMSWFWPSHLKAKNWVSYAPQGVAFVRHGWPQLLISQQIWTAHNNTGQHGTARDSKGPPWPFVNWAAEKPWGCQSLWALPSDLSRCLQILGFLEAPAPARLSLRLSGWFWSAQLSIFPGMESA